MRTRFRHLLLICILFVMPVQGFASATMFGCPISDQGSGTLVPTALSASADELMANCHEPGSKESAPHSQHDCNHCAACDLASSPLIPNQIIATFTPVPFSVIAPPAASPIGFIPDGPERPPRTSLA